MDAKEKFVVMKLRVAKRDDFSDQFDQKKLGTLYFCQSREGVIENKPYYFTENTDMVTFKQLYNCNQIFVPVRHFEEVEVWEEDRDMKSA